MNLKRKIALFVAYLLLSFTTYAQLTDTLFHYNFGITSRLSTGNLDQFLFNTSLRLEKSSSAVGARWVSNTFHQWLNDNQLDEDYYQSFIVFYQPLKKWSPYVLNRYGQSKRRGVDQRFQVGAGTSYKLIWQAENQVRLSGSLMYEWITFPSIDLHVVGNDADRKRRLLRATLVVFGQHNLLKQNLNINYALWIQPAVQRFADFRNEVNLNIDERIYKNLFLRVKLFYLNETVLPIEVEQHDLRLSFGVVLKN